MRQIILDTETTGLDPATGDRLVEIACVETINTVPSGENFHVYIDPQRDVPDEAFRIHGLSTEFLKGKPLFDQVVDDFLAFIGEQRGTSTRPVVIDLSHIDFIDSSGLGVLVQLAKQCQDAAIRFLVVGNARVVQTVKLVRLEEFLHLQPDLETALAALTA